MKQQVFVLAKDGTPLMPTKKFGMVRHFLKEKKAVPVCSEPFTIRLKFETTKYTQSLWEGVDTGREIIGNAVSDTDGRCILLEDVKTNNRSVHKNMMDRAGYRRGRRRHDRQNKQRKAAHDGTEIKKGEDSVRCSTHQTKSVKVSYPSAEESVECKGIRGKEAKFANRKRDEDWITPSARQLVQATMNTIKETLKVLPVTDLCVERVSFDFVKLDSQDIKKWQYGKGPLFGYKSYKDFVYEKQEGQCLLCGKPIEQYHHVAYKSEKGSNTVKNYAGLCCECHKKVHNDPEAEALLKEKVSGQTSQYSVSLLNSVMPELLKELAAFCEKNGIRLHVTTGYETAETRKKYGIPKHHCTDAYAISLTGRDVPKENISLPQNISAKRRFKKKSGANISKLGSRTYEYDGKVIATNRHKAMNQKSDSLEEYMTEYAETHTRAECVRHFHELKVTPAKRVYTYCKANVRQIFHPGDTIRYYKENKNGTVRSDVFVCTKATWSDKDQKWTVEGINAKGQKVGKDGKFCYRLSGGSLKTIQVADTEEYLAEVLAAAEKWQAKKT